MHKIKKPEAPPVESYQEKTPKNQKNCEVLKFSVNNSQNREETGKQLSLKGCREKGAIMQFQQMERTRRGLFKKQLYLGWCKGNLAVERIKGAAQASRAYPSRDRETTWQSRDAPIDLCLSQFTGRPRLLCRGFVQCYRDTVTVICL